jgi:hypothetical protein
LNLRTHLKRLREHVAWPADAMPRSLRSLAQPLRDSAKYLVPLAIFLYISLTLISVKVMRLDQQFGDSAMFFQVGASIRVCTLSQHAFVFYAASV